MVNLIYAIYTEVIKTRSSKFFWLTFVIFSLAPLMGSFFMLILKYPHLMPAAEAFKAKAQLMSFTNNWYSFFSLLSQTIGVGGLLVFGFVFSWVFGREYSENTIKDLLSLPTHRTTIITAKLILSFFWCFLLAVFNLLLGTLLGVIIGLEGFLMTILQEGLINYILTTLLAASINVPTAYLAISGKGYMAPLGFIAVTLVFSQILAAAGIGIYFPWALPGIFSGMGKGVEFSPNLFSYVVFITVVALGYIFTLLKFNFSDHSK